MSKLHLFLNTQSQTFHKRFKVSSDIFFKDIFNERKIMEFRVPDEKFLDPFAGKGTNGIDVCRTAIVFSKVTSEHVVEMKRGKLNQVTFTVVLLER